MPYQHRLSGLRSAGKRVGLNFTGLGCLSGTRNTTLFLAIHLLPATQGKTLHRRSLQHPILRTPVIDLEPRDLPGPPAAG